MMLFYEGNDPVTRRFTIEQKGRVVYTQNVRFSASEKSKTIHASHRSKEGFNFILHPFKP